MHLAWECTTSMSTTRPRRCASSIIAFSSSGVPHRLLACGLAEDGWWLVSSIAQSRFAWAAGVLQVWAVQILESKVGTKLASRARLITC